MIEAGDIDTAHYTPERIAAAISAAKNKLITADKYEPRAGSPLSHVVAEVYPAYQERLLASSAVDFDDLLLHVANLLLRAPGGARRARRAVPLRAGRRVPGHQPAPSTSIAAGAVDRPSEPGGDGRPRPVDLRLARGRPQQHPASSSTTIPACRSCGWSRTIAARSAILRVADELIAHNLRRKQKALLTENDEGGRVRLVAYATQDDEARRHRRADRRRRSRAGRRRPRDFAIFYRVNALSRSLEHALREHGVPYQMVRGQEFYQRKEIKDVLAYCQLVNNPRDDMAAAADDQHAAARHRQARRSTASASTPTSTACRCWKRPARRRRSKALNARVGKKVAGVRRDDRPLRRRWPRRRSRKSSARCSTESGYRASLAESDDEEDQNRLANIEELLTDARQFDEQHPERRRTWRSILETPGW